MCCRHALQIEPKKDVVRTIRKYWDQRIAWTNPRIANGFLESLNGVSQTAEQKARGYRDFHTIGVIFILLGGIDYSEIRMFYQHDVFDSTKSIPCYREF